MMELGKIISSVILGNYIIISFDTGNVYRYDPMTNTAVKISFSG